MSSEATKKLCFKEVCFRKFKEVDIVEFLTFSLSFNCFLKTYFNNIANDIIFRWEEKQENESIYN